MLNKIQQCALTINKYTSVQNIAHGLCLLQTCFNKNLFFILRVKVLGLMSNISLTAEVCRYDEF